jgi:hypothetical protein
MFRRDLTSISEAEVAGRYFSAFCFVLASARRSVFFRRLARFLALSLPLLFPISRNLRALVAPKQWDETEFRFRILDTAQIRRRIPFFRRRCNDSTFPWRAVGRRSDRWRQRITTAKLNALLSLPRVY